MIETFFRLAGITTIIGGAAAWWRWRSVRQSRQPAPLAHTLIRQPEPVHMRRHENQLTVVWSEMYQPVAIHLGSSPDQIAVEAAASITSDMREVTLPVDPRTRYFVELRLTNGETLQTAERFLPLANIRNFRDIGGYMTRDGRRVRWDRVYRSGRLSDLDANDLLWLQERGIRWVCDLRSPEEAVAFPDRLPQGARHLHLPPQNPDKRWRQIRRMLFERDYVPNMLRDLYMRVMIDNNTALFRTLFQHLADESNFPALIHCTAGKDRTGISTALLLALLGVDDETICADYSLSNYDHAFFVAVSQEVLQQARMFGISEGDARYWMIANGEVMRDTLAYIRQKYDSVEAYLRHTVGLDSEQISAIRQHLLE